MKPPTDILTITACIIPLLVIVTGCNRPLDKPDKEAYTPGLGEIMSLQQMRHAKLWFAGESGNWDLASYELDELEEGFADAVKYHPTHKTAPVPLTTLIPQFSDVQIGQLRDSVKARDVNRFTAAYDTFTTSCNACHQATQFGFNVVRRPMSPPFSNQEFTLKP